MKGSRAPQRRVLSCLGFALFALGTFSAPANSGVPGDSGSLCSADESTPSLTRLSQLMAKIPVGEPSLIAFAPIVVVNEADEAKLSKKARASLHQALLNIVGSAVSEGRRRESTPLSLAEASERARRRKLALVHLQPTLNKGELHLDVLVVKWPPSFWQRALNPGGSVTHRASFCAKADAAVRRYLPPERTLLSEKKIFKSPISLPIALACGDLRGDGGTDLLVVGRKQVAVGRFLGKNFTVEAILATSALSPLSKSPLRAPLGAVQIGSNGAFIGLSDRRDAVIVDADLKVVSRFSSRYPLPNGRCLAFNEEGLSDVENQCDAEKLKFSNVAILDAFSPSFVTEPNGTVTELSARTINGAENATLGVRRTGHQLREIELKNVGAVLAWADLDGDGTAELLASRASSSGDQDSLQIFSLRGEEMVETAVSKGGPIHALAVCPFTGTNPLSVVAAVGQELWVFP